MTKEEIANELLKNSFNIYIKAYIEKYLTHLSKLEKGSCDDEGLLRLHRCITYLSNASFDVTGWMLFEIPSVESHCFVHDQEQKFFDLAVFDNKKVEPQFLDKNGYLQKADSIEDAILHYSPPSLPQQ